MKKIILIVGLLVAFSASGKDHRSNAQKQIDVLIAQEEELNHKCRGGSGDEPATMKACDERDAIVEKLKTKGWCWGHDGQVEFKKQWEKCRK
jgi:hypothetical protein